MLTDTPRLWIEFADPDDHDQVIRADLSWLTSRWTCIFGRGCRGIDATMPDAGCCTLGAHFSDEADLARVETVAARLTAEEWQQHDEGRRGGFTRTDDDGDTVTRVVDGACIFHNRPGFPGGYGCALHAHALRMGTDPVATKPDVCWQLPLRRTYRTVERPDGSEYLEVSIGEYDRAGWGAGGHDLDWYCSDNPEAHVGTDPVYVSMRTELVELVGAGAYTELSRHCTDLLRRSLPLTVHPATQAACGTRPMPDGGATASGR